MRWRHAHKRGDRAGDVDKAARRDEGLGSAAALLDIRLEAKPLLDAPILLGHAPLQDRIALEQPRSSCGRVLVDDAHVAARLGALHRGRRAGRREGTVRRMCRTK